MRALRESGVAGRELDHPVGELEALEHRLGVRGHPLVLGVGLLGPGEADQLDLVELVHPDEPAGVLAVRARLAAEARRVGDVSPREIGRLEDLVPVQVGDRHLRGGNQEEVVRREAVEIVLELGELPGPGQRRPIHQIGRRDLDVAMLAGVEVEHESRERADQPGPRSPAARESRSR